jgi:predicted amidophosphoribosyltransferase
VQWFRMAKVVQSAPLCGTCGEPMKLIRTLPRLGGLPEVQTFVCKRCGQVTSLEFDAVGDRLPSVRPS